ncbi:MAG: MoxR family ATPase [Porticoccaceae bacterium]
MNARAGQDGLEAVVNEVSSVLIGKRHQIQLALCCLLARGHLLIEDLPGMGKTTLAHGLASALGLTFKRLQFTSDLLPSDILGISIYDRESEGFRFHPGPVFTQLLLADEINRSTPKTQSALLEAMAEGQVTIDGVSRDLAPPFFVIATQNPISQRGTYPLPESQQDRFAMCISLGYPDAEAEKQMLLGAASKRDAAALRPCLDAERLLRLQEDATRVHASEALADYILRLVRFTREGEGADTGLSPRASLMLLACARAWALLEGRDYVIPEDVQRVFPAVAKHRLHPHGEAGKGGALVQRALDAVDVV